MDIGTATLVTGLASTLIGGPIMWYLRQFDKRNTEQHAANVAEFKDAKAVVMRVEGKVDQVSHQLNDHIVWHLEDERVNP